MKITKYIVLTSVIASLLVLVSCGGSSGGGSPASKDLFSLWNKTTDNAPLDLTGGVMSVPLDLSFFFVGGEQCDCTFTVIGDQSSGNFIVNSCFYKFGSGASDPGCNALNSTGTYSLSNNTLTINGQNGVAIYK